MASKITRNEIDVEILGIKEAQIKAAKKGVKVLESKAPKKSGEYASGFGYEQTKKGENYETVIKGTKKKTVALAHILEFGTIGLQAQSPKPHWRPAEKQASEEYIKQAKKVTLKEK